MIVVASVAVVTARPERGCWVAIGNWDGMHLGHRSIIRHLVAGARNAGAQSVVVGFHPHPMAVLRPAAAPQLIQSLGERAGDLAEAGVDLHLVLPFDAAFAQLLPEEFVTGTLIEGLHAADVMVGFNFTFGRGGRGTAQTLAEMCRPFGVPVQIFAPVRVAGETVSSTAVRYFLAAGDVERAGELLGHRFRMICPVVAGDQRGRQLGYPTANLEIFPGRQLPATGVYAVRVTVLAEGQTGYPELPLIWPPSRPEETFLATGGLSGSQFGGMLNLGFRPTFHGREQRCEVHLLGFQGDLYGRRLAVEFVERLRPEQAFSGPDSLVTQLRQDEEATRQCLRGFDPGLNL